MRFTRSEFVRWAAYGLLAASFSAQAQVGMYPQAGYGPPTGCQTRESPGHSAGEIHLGKPQSLLTAQDDLHGAKMLSLDGRTTTLSISEPVANIGIEKMKAADYMDCTGGSGCYWSDLDAQYRRAEDKLATEVKLVKAGTKLALVMDIDETSLSSYCEMKRDDFGYIAGLNDEWVVSKDAALPIPGALRLFAEAKALGVAVFFVTGRPGVPDYSVDTPAVDQTEATARNLKAAGFDGWKGLVLRAGAENQSSTIDYKAGARQRIQAQGYTLAMSVGDQWSDLEGQPQALVSVKLPNPFYFIP
jgi:hypothetical protein